MAKEKLWRLAIDFDGTICTYESGWIAPGIIPDPPIEGALEFVQEMQKHFDEILIVSTRAISTEGMRAIYDWLKKYGFPDNILVTGQKHGASVYLDDRAVRFEGEYPSIEELSKPIWYERKGSKHG